MFLPNRIRFLNEIFTYIVAEEEVHLSLDQDDHRAGEEEEAQIWRQAVMERTAV
jgi:hypothetical protein